MNLLDIGLTFREDAGLQGSNMWSTSAVVGSKVIALPQNAGKLAVYDLETGSLVFKEDARLQGSGMWSTSAVVGSKVIALPQNAGKLAVYDVETGSLVFKEDARLQGNFMWSTSAVVGSKVIALPQNARKLAVYDVETGSFVFKEDAGLQGSNMWSTSAVVGSKVIALPDCAGKLAVYDVETGSFVFKEDAGLQGSFMWSTSAVVGSKVIGLPWSAGKLAIIDVQLDDTAARLSQHPYGKHNYTCVKHKDVHRSVTEANIELAASTMAAMLLQVIETGLGVPGIGALLGTFNGQIKSSLMNEDEREEISEYLVNEQKRFLLVVSLVKECKAARVGVCSCMKGSMVKMKIAGSIDYVEAGDDMTFKEMRQVVNAKGRLEIKRLLAAAEGSKQLTL